MAKKDLAASDKPVVQSERPVSRSQESFNALVDKINKRRATLAEWEAYGVEFERRYAGEYIPLRRTLDDVQTKLILGLDQSYDMKGLTKGERRMIGDLIVHLAEQVLESVDDSVVAEIHERYRPMEGRDDAGVKAEPKGDVEEVVSFEMPQDVDIDSPDDLMAHIQAQLDEQERRANQQRQAREASRATRKKASAKEAAAERARAKEAEAHLSLREVYRKLASALHPDREADPTERTRKAALMQRVNAAYASRSLLDLLEIQLEIEQIDQAAMESVSTERLKRWNTVLKEQLEGLEQELAEVDHGFQVRCGLTPRSSSSPKVIKRTLNAHIDNLRDYVRMFEDDIRIVSDIQRLKPWLREMKPR
ncbi:J domain-containing protein [Luteibacter yeojuensis]|uniref:Molecular chaperone DnaJ n=1 Tax=Luteibacter yeojuensis TaxID=345309 RepID=A0A0F3KVM6_9GAMM|nr:J domain-containing protein [Luteibacter yeojuensis]KJV35268.1 hypothetical protein VI08_08185 [Luteibacter yeojuensis]